MSNLLSLEDFRKIIGHNPYHFWQLSNNKVPSFSNCDNILRKYSWQNSAAIGRSRIEEAIGQAEASLTSYLGFNPGPVYQSLQLPLTCPYHYDRRYYAGYGSLVNKNYLKLGISKLQSIGTLTRVKIATTADLAITDNNSDGVKDYFSCTVADTTTDVADVEAYFSSSDRLGLSPDADYQIRPVVVTRFDANTLKIEGNSWLLVKPSKYEIDIVPGFEPAISGTDSSGAFDPDNLGNFVTQIDIYKKVISAANQATVSFYNAGSPVSSTVNAYIADANTGLISLSGCQFYGSCYCNSTAPVATVNFISGDNLQTWKTVIARYAVAEINAPLCPCGSKEVTYWQRDKAQTGATDAQGIGNFYRIDNDDLRNPLGTKEGHIQAWKMVKNLRLIDGLGN